jgi:hypothetical protein
MMTLDKFYSTESQEDIEWFKKYRSDWMTDDQWLCHLFLSQLFLGFHHVGGTPKAHGSGIQINLREHRLATFDYDYLTKAVIMAHNWCVRFSIEGSGPGMIKLVLFKRGQRDGNMWHRHPTIDEAIKKYQDK